MKLEKVSIILQVDELKVKIKYKSQKSVFENTFLSQKFIKYCKFYYKTIAENKN